MKSQRDVRFTKLGIVAVAIMVATWVGGIAFGHLNPNSWLGHLINAPFGFAAYIFVVGVIFSGIGAVFGALGKPFIERGHDA